MAYSRRPDSPGISSRLLSCITIPPEAGRLLVAYSGGLDSHVLLHVLNSIERSAHMIIALHIHHGLNRLAGQWAQHCKETCRDMGIDCKTVELNAAVPDGESVQAWARKQRYKALAEFVEENDILFTAHHQDDLAETVLLQLFRGGGPAGLAAMPQRNRFGRGWHYRPFLGIRRNELKEYAIACGLKWVEDDSNAKERYDRNYLRNRVMPLLQTRWPGITGTLARAAGYQAAAAVLMDELAQKDLENCINNTARSIRLSRLCEMSGERSTNLLRFWIRNLGFPVPGGKKITHIISDVIQAGPNTCPVATWQGTEIRRYRDNLYIMKPIDVQAVSAGPVCWDVREPCTLPLGSLQAVRGKGGGIKISACPEGILTIRFRSGGEIIRSMGHHRSLKKLFQENAVLPWYRNLVPLLYAGNNLVAVTGICIDENYLAGDSEESWQITWTAADMIRAD